MNEKQINEWLREQLATLDTRGITDPMVAIYADRDPDNCAGVQGFDADSNFRCHRGATIAAAFAKLRASVSIDPATQLREQAAKLLRKAGELEAEQEAAK